MLVAKEHRIFDLRQTCLVALLAFAASCGGDDKPQDTTPDATVFVPATHENMMLFRELHGTIGLDGNDMPIRALRPSLWIRGESLEYEDDIPYEDEFGVGCAANSWDLQTGDKMTWGDMGDITVAGYSGTGGGVDNIEVPTTLDCVFDPDQHAAPYQCPGLPEMIVEGPIDDLKPASVINTGDKVTYDVEGGSATRDRPLDREALELPEGFTIDSPDMETIDLENPTDFEIVMNCEDAPRCGPVNVAMFLYSDNPDPFGKPIRYYQEVWCSYLADDNTIEVKAEHLSSMNDQPWKSAVIEVLRMKFPTGIFPDSASGSASGYFYAYTRE